ncbi:hypothetical protein ANCCAN_14211 [Ancylostoma caninum]|uniref:Paired domain-containing protein n=1 Tax=Ancylostoma caninum TaxID=29170 RepID=A0A368GA43_ANCCA|nr:hypothetical protein ANCCAN_14211 [Ancylostoma caninum]
MSSKEKRGAVIALHREGVPNLEIARRLRMPRSTVYDAVKRFRRPGDCKDRPKAGRPKPQRSMWKMASDLGVSERTVRRFVKEDLNLRPFKMQKGHYLKG